MNLGNPRIVFNQQTWEIRTPKAMVRYIDPEFVSKFFDTGELMLSTFNAFHSHPDEAMRDLTEGRLNLETENPNAKGSYLVGFSGIAYVLCASMASPRALSDSDWKREDGIQIANSVAFSSAVARHIPGFTDGIEGPCEYRDDDVRRVVETEEFVGPREFPGGAEAYFEAHKAGVWEHMKDDLFIKHSRFEHEREYRFVWFSNAGDRDKPLLVRCPEAREFCKRIQPAGDEDVALPG